MSARDLAQAVAHAAATERGRSALNEVLAAEAACWFAQEYGAGRDKIEASGRLERAVDRLAAVLAENPAWTKVAP